MADNTGPLEGTPSQGLQQDTRAPSILRSGSEMASTSENVPFTFTANVLSSFSNLSLGANDQAENPSLRRQSLAPSGASSAFTSRQLFNASPLPSREPSPQLLEPEPSPGSAPPGPSHTTPSLYSGPPSPFVFGDQRSRSSPSPFTFQGSGSQSPPPSFPFRDSSPRLSFGHCDPFTSTRESNAQSNHPPVPFTSQSGPQPRPASPPDGHNPIKPPPEPERNEVQLVVPYDIKREEPLPPHPYFTEDFQRNGIGKGIDWAKNVAGALQQFGDTIASDADLKRFADDANRLSRFESHDTRTIAVLGDSGEGKSSLINSLLHCPDIAKTGEIGMAVTSVVTEYRYKMGHHTAPFTIEVDHLTPDEIKDTIKELVWNYRQFFLVKPDAPEVSEEDYKRCEREMEVALASIKSAFGHQTGLKRLLDDRSEGAEQRMVEQLTEWSNDLPWPEGGSDSVWNSTAETAEECCEKTGALMTERLWPFTKVIRVFLKAQVLQTGVVLADLPGLHDNNLAKVRATEQYILSCDHIFVVGKISRAISDQSLKSSLFTAIKQHIPYEWDKEGLNRLKATIVCTRSEDMDEKKMIKTFCGDGKAISAAEMKTITDTLHTAERRNDGGEKKLWKLKRKMLLMQARNHFVQDGLQKAYAEKVLGGTLQTICVSNKLYEKNVEKGQRAAIQASEIPELRRRCHAVTAQSRYMEAKNLLVSSLPSLLNSMKIWVSTAGNQPAATLQAKTELLRSVDKLHDNTMTSVEDFKRSMIASFEEQIARYVTHRSVHWEEAAQRQADEWDGWHWASYDAFCRHNGTYSTPAVGRHRWNNQLVWKMRSDLDTAWPLLEEDISTTFGDLLDALRKPMRALKAVVREHDAHLASSMDLRFRDLKYQLGLIEHRFAQGFAALRRAASEDTESSFVLACMLSAYRAASSDRGMGKAARQRATIRRRIGREGLFPNMALLIAQRMQMLVAEAEAAVRTKAGATVVDIRKDFEMALAEVREEDPSAQAKEQIRGKVEEWEAALKKILDDAIGMER